MSLGLQGYPFLPGQGRGILAAYWGILAAYRVVLVVFWGVLSVSCGLLGASYGTPWDASLARLGVSWGVLGGVSGAS